MAYQVDFLPVGDGAKSGDASAMRFGDFSSRLTHEVVVIDGGFISSGEALVKHIQEVHGTGYVDLSSRPIPTPIIPPACPWCSTS